MAAQRGILGGGGFAISLQNAQCSAVSGPWRLVESHFAAGKRFLEVDDPRPPLPKPT